MSYHVNAIILNEHFERYTLKLVQTPNDKRLINLSKINIFVGANNSGKSKFLRHLAAIDKLQFVPHLNLPMQWTWEMIAEVAESFRTNVQQCFASHGIQKADGMLQQLSSIPKLHSLQEGTAPVAQLLTFAEHLSQLNSLGTVHSDGRNYDTRTVLRQLKQFSNTLLTELRNLPSVEKIPEYHFTKLYIPTLRGLRNLETETRATGTADDLYSRRTVVDYFSEGKSRPEIFTGLTLYKDIQKLLLGNLSARSKIRDFEQFLSEMFFEKRPVALIPKLDTDVLDIKIGDEAERPIQLLGDGVQSIIILTFPLFMNRDKSLLIFYEEPELYLHPGLQRLLLTVLHQFQDNQYFLTTHSNHFLGLTLDFVDVSVYTFQKDLQQEQGEERNARFEIENLTNEDTRPLELLGVRNSSVLLSNCTTWVEGITDRRYYRAYLNLYQDSLPPGAKRFQEDLHYSFLEYGGSNITHFSFLDATVDPIAVERLCSKLFLVTDKDNAKGEKAARHTELKERLKERYYCLECKEVENLLAPHIINAVVKKYEEGEPEFQEFEQKDYQRASLGEFIDGKVLKSKRTRKVTYAKGGTIRDKIDFCLKAVEELKSLSDLSPEAQKIAELLYHFIAENN